MKTLALSLALISSSFAAPQISDEDCAEVGKEFKHQLQTAGFTTDEGARQTASSLAQGLPRYMQYSPRLVAKLKKNIPIRPKNFYNNLYEEILKKEKNISKLPLPQQEGFKKMKAALLHTKIWLNAADRPAIQKEGMVLTRSLTITASSHRLATFSPATLELTKQEAQTFASHKNIKQFLQDAKSMTPSKIKGKFHWGQICHKGTSFKFALNEPNFDIEPAFFHISENTLKQLHTSGAIHEMDLKEFKDTLKIYTNVSGNKAAIQLSFDPNMSLGSVIKRMNALQSQFPKGHYPSLAPEIEGQEELIKPKVTNSIKRRPPLPKIPAR